MLNPDDAHDADLLASQLRADGVTLEAIEHGEFVTVRAVDRTAARGGDAVRANLLCFIKSESHP